MTAPLFKRVDCLSIPVSDLDAALAFYSGQLGHELIWRSNTADSVPEALVRFTSGGGKILRGPFEIQIGRCAVVEDPWNNVLVILDASKGTLLVDENKRVI